MKLNELIEALAREVELAEPHLIAGLEQLAVLDESDSAFIDALDSYGSQAQRMGEAAEMAGFPGLQAVCEHVVANCLLLPMLAANDRGPVLEFLLAWPPAIVYYLRHIDDPSAAAGVVDRLRAAPHPMEEQQALRVMHMLGSIPAAVDATRAEPGESRPILANPEDVALVVPEGVDPRLMEAFATEAPGQVRYLVDLLRNLASGQGDSSDLQAAKRVAHTLKGSGAIIGLRGLTTLGHHAEDIFEHFDRTGTRIAAHAADVLLDAAYCLEQMVGFVVGNDEYPQQSLAVLQRVLDFANRIDRGESAEEAVHRVGLVPSESAQAQPLAAVGGVAATLGAALRISVAHVDELFRLSGEMSVQGAAMEARVKSLSGRAKELLEQNLRVQKRLFELETLVDIRALTMMRTHGEKSAQTGFDPLEMDQYNELHSTAHALIEEAADSRVIASRLVDDIASLLGGQARQQRITKDMQHLVIGTRMAEVGSLEPRLQRNIRTTCQATGKQATLRLRGGETLIDSDVLTRLADPLLHLLRNAVDHGVEMPNDRLNRGKPAAGNIDLEFSRQGQQVVLRCTDDGQGLDLDAIRRRALERGLIGPDQSLSADETARLIFQHGFTTRDSVTEVSGRGVGLDVVREWASSMNGSARVTSTDGVATSIELRFAASLSTLQSLIVDVAGQRYALPSIQIEQAVPRSVGTFEDSSGQLVYRHGKRVLRAALLSDLVGTASAPGKSFDERDAVLFRHNEQVMAIAVDGLVDARELLVKSPGRYAQHVRGVSGLSILGDGSICVNLDLPQLLAEEGYSRHTIVAPTTVLRSNAPRAAGILIVDDALTVRNSLLQLISDAGFRAETARDGVDAINTLRDFHADLVLTDLEMPNMNGIELTTHLRGRAETRELPIIMITSRSQDKHRRLADEAGVSRYFTKPYNEGDLLQAIREALAA